VPDEKILAGLLVVLAAAVSFVLTIFFFGFVLLAGVLVTLVGLALMVRPSTRPKARRLLGGAGVTLVGPVLYVALAFL
jgi:hypothetical protein